MDEQGDDNVFADITNKQLFKSPTPKKTAKLTELQPDDEENEEVQKHSNLPTNFKKSPTTVKDWQHHEGEEKEQINNKFKRIHTKL